MGSVVVEENKHTNDSIIPSKTTAAHIIVDSLPGERNETSEGCNHFSIRGYVAEIRKIDRTACFPFGSHNHDNNSVEKTYELPPLDVPKFRWWQCHGCLRGSSGSERIAEELLMLPSECDIGNDCNVTSSQKLVGASVLVLPLQDNGQTSKLSIRERHNHEASTSDSTDTRICVSLCNEQQEKGLGNGLADDLPGDILRSIPDVVEVDVLVQDPHSDDLGAPDKKCNGVIESTLQTTHCVDVCLPETCQSERRDSDDDQQRDAPAVEVTGVQGRLIPLPDLNTCDDVFAENDEIIAGTNPCDDEEDDFSGAPHRKTRKTRLLSELLGLKDNRDTEYAVEENAFPVDFLDRSTGKSLALVNGNGNLRFTGHKTRKTSNGGGYRFVVDNDNTMQKSVEISESVTVDASTEIDTQSVAKGHNNHSLKRNRNLQKRDKKNRVDEDGGFSLVSKEKASPKGNLEKTLVKMQQIERNSVPFLKKKLFRQPRKEKTYIVPWKNFKSGECSTVGKDAAAGTAMHHLHNRYLSVGSNSSSTYLSPVQERLCAPSVQKELILTDNDKVVSNGSENEAMGELIAPFTAAAAAPFVERSFYVEGERSIYPNSSPKGKQKLIPEVEGGCLPLAENMVPLCMHKKGMNAEVQGQMRDIDINTIPIDDNVLEQRPSDDIPMDIIELMAKHQHERRGDSAKETLFTMRSNGYERTAAPPLGSFSNSCGVRPFMTLNLCQDHFPGTERSQSGTTRNCLIRGFDDAVPFKQRSAGRFPEIDQTRLNFGYPKETYPLGRIGGSAQYQERNFSDPSFSSRGFSWHNWSGNSSSQRYPHGFIQGLEPSNGCPSYSQQNTGTLVGPSVNPNRIQGILPQHPDKQRINPDRGVVVLNGVNLGKQSTKLTEYSSAMQLLNLMHTGGTRPTTMSYSGDRNPEFLKWPPFRHDQRFNQFANSRHPSSLDNGGRNFFPENPRSCCSSVPTVRAFAPPFFSEAGAGKNSGIMNSFSFTSREPLHVENYGFQEKGGDFTEPQTHANPSRNVGGRQQPVSVVEKGKSIGGASSSGIPPPQTTKERAVLPVPRTEICLLNKNPAEFNDLNLSRRYVIGVEELRPVKGTREKSAKRPDQLLKLGDSRRREKHRNSRAVFSSIAP
ncbi:hypothetical protein Nepgr_000907 [Nepenthes gracilis]|uniref:Uncharacterized protein n=1 Tax=Nepenthes gracilis TaxID=150966 RepID=A0AAD3P487_NEPGR|nr:hypothetical protein Nepgr_000907 [Nepenthes gracilis]